MSRNSIGSGQRKIQLGTVGHPAQSQTRLTAMAQSQNRTGERQHMTDTLGRPGR